jgi:hypothetical protein
MLFEIKESKGNNYHYLAEEWPVSYYSGLIMVYNSIAMLT